MMKKAVNCINPELIKLYSNSAKLEKITSLIATQLPKHLQGKVFAASFNKGVLLLSSEQPAHASELRYLIPNLRNTLRNTEGLYHLVSIKIMISKK